MKKPPNFLQQFHFFAFNKLNQIHNFDKQNRIAMQQTLGEIDQFSWCSKSQRECGKENENENERWGERDKNDRVSERASFISGLSQVNWSTFTVFCATTISIPIAPKIDIHPIFELNMKFVNVSPCPYGQQCANRHLTPPNGTSKKPCY